MKKNSQIREKEEESNKRERRVAGEEETMKEWGRERIQRLKELAKMGINLKR